MESATNPEWKALRKALAQGRCLEGRYWIAETPRLLAEAVRSGLPVYRVYASARQLEQLQAVYAGRLKTDWVEVSARAMQATASTETSQEVFALVERPATDPAHFFANQRFLVVLDRVQDPGNTGTIIRSAEAFGATGLVFLKGSASPDAPKVLRASAGSLFRLPFLDGVPAEEFMASAQRLSLYAASPEAKVSIDELPLRFPAALVIGNEGAGVSPALDAVAEGFRIPTRSVESLNAGVSAGIALYVMGKVAGAHGATPLATGKGGRP
ncbi:MAG: RNA methyltransferase [Bryobacterales bacterium]|nr:RNA methyltransferase [Bryobacterales bacterium]